jgi:hypothetical protein
MAACVHGTVDKPGHNVRPRVDLRQSILVARAASPTSAPTRSRNVFGRMVTLDPA